MEPPSMCRNTSLAKGLGFRVACLMLFVQHTQRLVHGVGSLKELRYNR